MDPSKAHAIGTEILSTLVPEKIGQSALVEKMNLFEESGAGSDNQVDRWRKGAQPEPRIAWTIGESLRAPHKRHPAFGFCSGLLALNWFGHYADFAAVLGVCDEDAIRPHLHVILALLKTLRRASHVSRFDKLSWNHAIFDGTAREVDLRMIADVRTHDISLYMDFATEADALNARKNARDVWRLSPELHALLYASGQRWFGSFKSVPKGEPIPELTTDLDKKKMVANMPLPLRDAYEIASSDLSEAVRESQSLDLIARWIYSTSEALPTAEAALKWMQAVKEPWSDLAYRCRVELAAYAFMEGNGESDEIGPATYNFHDILRVAAANLVEHRLKPRANPKTTAAPAAGHAAQGSPQQSTSEKDTDIPF